MNCHYCQQPCTPLDAWKNIKLFRWECENGCGTVFLLRDDNKLISTIWKDVCIRDKHYSVKIYDGITGNAPQCIISYYIDNVSGSIGRWEEIIRWNFVPKSWTPQNVKQKLSTYLLFL